MALERIRVSEEDLGLLELVAGQISKAKKRSFCPEEYEQAAQKLREIKDSLTHNEISEQDYTDFFGSKRPFYIAPTTQEEFYVTRRNTLFCRRNFKAYCTSPWKKVPETLVFN